MASIENRSHLLARLAGRTETSPDSAANESAVRAQLLAISEMIAAQSGSGGTAKDVGASITALAKGEIELVQLLGKASMTDGTVRAGLRAEINGLLQTIHAETPRLKMMHAERRKEEIAAHVEEMAREAAPQREAKAAAPRQWQQRATRDMKQPLAVEIPDSRTIPALHAFEEFLTNVESQPKTIDEMVSYIEKRLGKDLEVDPRFRKEAKEFVRMMGTIKQKIFGRGGAAGLDDATIREQASAALERIKKVKAQAADTLGRIDDGRPIEALPESNVFRELEKLNRMPYFLGAMSAVAEELNMSAEAKRMRGIREFRGNALTRPVNQLMFYGGIGAFTALAFGSFAFAGTGVRNFIINASYYTPYLDEMKAFMGKKGYTVEDIDYGIQLLAKVLGIGTSIVGTKWMLNYRAGVENNPQRVKFWIGAIVCVFGALAGIIEKGANALDVVDQKKAADPALGKLKEGALALPAQLDAAAKALGKGAETFVSTEAGNGGTGAATMCTAYTYLGRPSPQLISEFDAFKRDKDKKGDHAKRLDKYKEGIDEINKKDKYKKFGFELGKRGVKHAVEDLVKKIDPSLALAALSEFSTRSEAAGSTTMAGHILGDLDIPYHLTLGKLKLFGDHDDTLSIVSLKNNVAKEFKKLLFDKYQEELGSDITLLLEYLDDVSVKTGVNLKESAKRDKGKVVGEVLKIESLLKLPELGITDKHFKDLDQAVGDGAITSAFRLLSTSDGRVKLGKSIRAGTPWKTFDENSVKDVSLFVAFMGSLYFGFDVGPGSIIEYMNRAAERRFRTEMGQKFNETYAIESNISMTVATYLNASLAAGSGYLDMKDLGSAFAVPVEIIAVHVRRKLAEKALKEIPELSGARTGHAKMRRFTSPIGFLEKQLGFKNPYYDPDVQGQNAKVAWLREIEARILKNDMGLVEELAAEIAPQYPAYKKAIEEYAGTQRREGIFNIRKQKAEENWRELRHRQLELIVSEIPAQVAILKATQQRILTTTSPEDDKPLVLGTTGRLRVTPEFIKRTFLLNRIGNDIRRYQVAYEQAREAGIRVESAMDVTSPMFNAAAGSGEEWQWLPSSAPEQAAIDQLIGANSRRFSMLSQESEKLDMRAFETYMNDLNTGMVPILHDFNARMPYLMRGKKDLVVVFDRDDETGRGVVSIKLLDTPQRPDGSPGDPEAIASVQFDERPIPDFSNETASAADALEALKVWLANGGDAMITMRAHIQRRELATIVGDYERRMLRESPDLRFEVTPRMDYLDAGSSRSRYEDFAILKNLREWKRQADTYFTELDAFGKTVDVKHIDAPAATAIAALYSDARNPSVTPQKDARMIQAAATFALKNLPDGARLWYDAKPEEPEFVVVLASGHKARFPVATPSSTVAALLKK
jgi:hypothetical protein